MILTSSYVPPLLPLSLDLESRPVLKKLASAHRALAELKGTAGLVPNEAILINTLSLQEAKDSSAIENIVTTQDDLYRSDDLGMRFHSTAAKEVYSYAEAMRTGFQTVRTTGLITINDILAMQATLERNQAGFRRLPGTALKNYTTGEVVFTPPQTYDEIASLMANLEQFINDGDTLGLDPLLKMAVIHHQFETIHPFYDGNGRTGRILNILYLVKENLLGPPILYLSRYINQHKADYYRLLQAVRTEGAWEQWIMFMLEGVEQMAGQTTRLVHQIRDLMFEHKVHLRRELPRIYSQDLLNNTFSHPYSKIAYVERDLGVSRITATRYLNEMTRIGLMRKRKFGRDSYYMNHALIDLLASTEV